MRVPNKKQMNPIQQPPREVDASEPEVQRTEPMTEEQFIKQAAKSPDDFD